ncbi:MAG: hypothetical protein QOH71_200 [Blastocatellia bacterium]|jgi:hypothetical protein|nr:hypothetical protein [Blastocatellia bacterium]
MQEHSRFRVFGAAIWADFKLSRGWKFVTISYGLTGLASIALWFITFWTPAQLLQSWSGKAKLVLLLAFVCVGLFLLLIVVVDGAQRVHRQAIAPLYKTLDEQKWLVELAERDRDFIGDGVAITECVLRLNLECRNPYAEFTFLFFNGSVFPISIETELDGFIAFCDNHEIRELKDRPSDLRSKSFIDEGKRYAKGAEFTIRQALNPGEVEFISAGGSRNGYFLFDNLDIMVGGYSEELGEIRHSRLLMENYVRPRLKSAYREDETALESKRQAHLSKIENLNVIRGLGLQLWALLRLNDQQLDQATLGDWERNVCSRLTESYGEEGAKKIYEELSHGDSIPDSASFQRGWIQAFFAQLQYFISEEKKKF